MYKYIQAIRVKKSKEKLVLITCCGDGGCDHLYNSVCNTLWVAVSFMELVYKRVTPLPHPVDWIILTCQKYTCTCVLYFCSCSIPLYFLITCYSSLMILLQYCHRIFQHSYQAFSYLNSICTLTRPLHFCLP